MARTMEFVDVNACRHPWSDDTYNMVASFSGQLQPLDYSYPPPTYDYNSFILPSSGALDLSTHRSYAAAYPSSDREPVVLLQLDASLPVIEPQFNSNFILLQPYEDHYPVHPLPFMLMEGDDTPESHASPVEMELNPEPKVEAATAQREASPVPPIVYSQIGQPRQAEEEWKPQPSSSSATDQTGDDTPESHASPVEMELTPEPKVEAATAQREASPVPPIVYSQIGQPRQVEKEWSPQPYSSSATDQTGDGTPESHAYSIEIEVEPEQNLVTVTAERQTSPVPTTPCKCKNGKTRQAGKKRMTTRNRKPSTSSAPDQRGKKDPSSHLAERRRKNNESSKRSRDTRLAKEEKILSNLAALELKNKELKSTEDSLYRKIVMYKLYLEAPSFAEKLARNAP